MADRRRRRQKKQLKEVQNQEMITNGSSMVDIEEMINLTWGTERIVTTITIPYRLYQTLKEVLPWIEANKSLGIAYMMNQGITRWKEQYAKEN